LIFPAGGRRDSATALPPVRLPVTATATEESAYWRTIMETEVQPGPDMPAVPNSAGEADEAREAPLAMDAAGFRRAGHALVDSVASFLEALPRRPVVKSESPEEVRALVGADRPLPEEGTDADELLDATAALLFDHSLFNGHPRFFGYITSPPAAIGILGDFLAGAVNANVGAWRLAPVATEIESQAVRWIAELVGYSSGCGGLFVSGGNMANIAGLFAARAAAAKWDIRATGVDGTAGGRTGAPAGSRDDGATNRTKPLRIYASAETHTWIQKGADLSGVGTNAIHWIGTDRELRMDPAALRRALESDREAGQHPLMVVATAGSVSTGAVDPLFEIAEICREAGVWLHVDGAYGAFAAAVPGSPPDLQALRLADSVAVDPHKWLYAPLEAGCVLVRDAERLRDAFAYHPPYYHFGQGATNFSELGPQNSRGFRALKVWLALRHAGRAGYVRMIGDDIRLSQRLHRRVATHPELEAHTQELSITTFRYVPSDLRAGIGTAAVQAYLNDLNQALLERIQSSGEAFVSNAVVRGQYLLRACIVNFHTRAGDVDALPEIVARLGREADAELRSPVPDQAS
jgi:aromatic-L-amino-acid/L-tryptophan decarboxylase